MTSPTSHRVATSRLVELNGIAPGEVLHGGTVLLVPAPAPAPAGSAPATTPGTPADAHLDEPGGRAPRRDRASRRVRVPRSNACILQGEDGRHRRLAGGGVRRHLGRAPPLERPRSAGAPARGDDAPSVRRRPREARSDALAQRGLGAHCRRRQQEFFAHFEEKGRRRIVVQAAAGETLEVIGKRHGVSAKLMERINRRGKSEPLAAGESVVLYVPHNDGPRPGELAARADVLPLPPPPERFGRARPPGIGASGGSPVACRVAACKARSSSSSSAAPAATPPSGRSQPHGGDLPLLQQLHLDSAREGPADPGVAVRRAGPCALDGALHPIGRGGGHGGHVAHPGAHSGRDHARRGRRRGRERLRATVGLAAHAVPPERDPHPERQELRRRQTGGRGERELQAHPQRQHAEVIRRDREGRRQPRARHHQQQAHEQDDRPRPRHDELEECR